MTKKIKAIPIILSAITLVTAGMLTVSAAGNYHDTPYTTRFSGTGDDPHTDARGKWDYSSSYIKSNNSAPASFSVEVVGSRDGRPASYWYDADHMPCTYGPYKHISPGQASYLPNLVKERGFPYCNLAFLQDGEYACTVTGWWSPDCV